MISSPSTSSVAPPPYPGTAVASGGSSPAVVGGPPHPPPPFPSSSQANSPHPAAVTPPSMASPRPAPTAVAPLPGGTPPVYSDADEKQRIRFQIELEFVQCLGNPNYLHFLAQRGYFRDAKFVNYLSYLQYWQRPAYVRFIKYPLCLHFLELLQHESFRREVVNGACAKFLDDQSLLHWQHDTRKRIKLIESASSSAGQNSQGATGSAVPSGATTPASQMSNK